MDASLRVGNDPANSVLVTGPVDQDLQAQNEKIKRVVGVILIALGIVFASAAFTCGLFGLSMSAIALSVGSIVSFVVGSILFSNNKKEQLQEPIKTEPVASTQVEEIIDEQKSTTSTQLDEIVDEQKSTTSTQLDEIVDELKSTAEFITDVLSKIDRLQQERIYEELQLNPLFKGEIKTYVDDYRKKYKEAEKKWNDESDKLEEVLEEKTKELASEKDKATEEPRSEFKTLESEYDKLHARYKQNDPLATSQKLLKIGEVLGKAEQKLKEMEEKYQQQLKSFRQDNYDVPCDQVEKEFRDSKNMLKQNFQECVERLLPPSI